MVYVTDAAYVSDYKIRLRFSDRREGVVDLQEVIKSDHRKIFRELEDVNRFQDFHVGMDTIVWSNGLDLAPEFLWERVV
jgi:hypothetical protein